MTKLLSFVAIAALLLSACGSYTTYPPTGAGMKFCDCVTSGSDLSPMLVLQACNPDTTGGELSLELTLESIENCDAFYEQIRDLQADMNVYRAEEDLAILNSGGELSEQQARMAELYQHLIDGEYKAMLELLPSLYEAQLVDEVTYRWQKSYAHEQLGQYQEAIEEFEALKASTGEEAYSINIALIRRKQKG